MAAAATASRVFSKEELCLMEKVPEPCGIVIFGASGDLAHRKLYPALFDLAQANLLPKNFYIVGVARTAIAEDKFRTDVRQSIDKEKKNAASEEFVKHFYYVQGDYSDQAVYTKLAQQLKDYDTRHGVANHRIFYLSTPPNLFEPIARELQRSGLHRTEGGWSRIVIEKPFGRDAASANALNKTLRSVFKENQIYRIDHYLGKETVQNILMFRFANAIYEPVWNNRYIDHVQITAAESAGVEHRAGYYEQAGVLRDMFQNHLFQLMCLVAMEPPSSLEADAMRDEKTKVLASLRPFGPKDFSEKAIRGQYSEGTADKQKVPAYRKEEGVSPQSTIETFAALQVNIDNWRWQGVPFYLRSGKRMPERTTSIAVQFKPVPTSIFKPLMAEQLSPNVLHFRIQPNEGIVLRFEAKHPGPKLCMSSVAMDFDYDKTFKTDPPEAYARLFLDIMLGDQTLFARHDWLERSWNFITPLLESWKEQGAKGLEFYPAGSWGPPSAEALLNKENRQWMGC